MTEDVSDSERPVWGPVETGTRAWLRANDVHPLHALVLLYLAERCDSGTTAQAASLGRAYLAAVAIITGTRGDADEADAELLAILRNDAT